MISYHPASANAPVGQHFTHGFLAADVDCPHRIAKCIQRFAWAPARFKDGYRTRANVIHANWLGLDFESAEMTLDQAVKSFADMIHVIGTTRNHQVEKDGVTLDRFRVLIKAERLMGPEEIYATLRHIAKRYPIDPSCIEPARHFFPCREIVSISDEGYLQEVTPPPPPPTEKEIMRAEIKATLARRRFEATGAMAPWIKAFLEQGRLCRAGGRNNTIYAVAVALRDLGLSQDTIYRMIQEAPISRDDMTEKQVAATIQSAIRRKRE